MRPDNSRYFQIPKSPAIRRVFLCARTAGHADCRSRYFRAAALRSSCRHARNPPWFRHSSANITTGSTRRAHRSPSYIRQSRSCYPMSSNCPRSISASGFAMNGRRTRRQSATGATRTKLFSAGVPVMTSCASRRSSGGWRRSQERSSRSGSKRYPP